jgi:protein-tyrosine phosphatase
MGYVDIHSHILHGLDDGSKTVDESLEMLQIAAAAGTTDIVATPHANGRYHFDPVLIDQRIEALAARAPADIRIHRGCDFHLQTDNIEDALANPGKYTINHLGYLLVEFSDLHIFASTDEILNELIGAGMVPIITHPERNRQLQQRVDEIARWVELGCCVQVTAGSCTGTFGGSARRCVHQLMERGLLHFVASDAHDRLHRSPSLREAYEGLCSRWGEELTEPLFVDNPRAVLTGERFESEGPALPVRRRRWYQFW